MNTYNTQVTVELRELVDSGVKIWDFDYPSYYSGEEKAAFEQKVIDHFYFRQIGFETVGRFKHMFKAHVRKIMPYYIQRYKSVDLLESVEDPFESYNLTEEITSENTGKTTQSDTRTVDLKETESIKDVINGDNSSSEAHSDTPQGYLGYGELDPTYISDAKSSKSFSTDERTGNNSRANTGTDSVESNTDNEGTFKQTLTRKGNIGVQPLGAELEALRKAFINVDAEVIEDLECLFLKIY